MAHLTESLKKDLIVLDQNVNHLQIFEMKDVVYLFIRPHFTIKRLAALGFVEIKIDRISPVNRMYFVRTQKKIEDGNY